MRLACRLVLATALLATGCSVTTMRARQLAGKLHRAGLVEHTYALDNGQVRTWHGGEGEAVLLLHGFGGDGVFLWHPQARALAAEYRVVMPDLLWFGGSASDSTDYSTVFQADTVVQLLDELDVERAHVVGVSYGGLVALELLAGWPERVDHLVLVDTPGHTYTVADYDAMLADNDIDSVADLVVPDGPEGVQRLVRLAWHRAPPVPGFVRRDVYRHMFTTHTDEKRALIDDLLQRIDDPAVLAAGVQVPPTLVLWGEHDQLFPVDIGRRLATALDADLHILPETNHAPNLERPAEFNLRLMTFLDPASSSIESDADRRGDLAE